MNPTLFNSTLFTLSSLWFFSILSIFLGFFILIKLAHRSRLRIQFIADVSIPVILGGLIIGRFFTVFINAQYYFYEFNSMKIYQMLAFWQDKEISFWGTILGASYLFIRKANRKQENLYKWGDVLIISFLFALSLGNIGAFFDGMNYGHSTSMPWGVIFNNTMVHFTGLVHPTQLYAALYTFGIGSVCYLVHKQYKNQYNGLTFLIGATLFSTFRLLEGFFRGDIVQKISFIRVPELLFFIATLYFWNKLYKYGKSQQVPFLRKYILLYQKLFKFLPLNK